MNKKGESILAMFITITIVIIVGLVLLQASAPNVATITTTQSIANRTYTWPANGANLTLEGQATSGLIAINSTGNISITSPNYTVSNYVLSNGALISRLTVNAVSSYSNQPVNISYTYEPYGYATNGGTRAITGLVLIFTSLAILVVAFLLLRESDVFDIFKG